MINEFDFYSGYEGEPELIISQIREDGSVKTLIKLWIGYFDSLLELINPNSKGEWEGIVLNYHTQPFWYNIAPLKYENQKLFIEQLESIENSQLEVIKQNILLILIDTFKDSVLSNEKINFEYE